MTLAPASTAELRALYDRLGPAGYQRACAHACWRAGNLSYGLHAGQLRARSLVYGQTDRRVKLAVWNISRRWGKSKAAVAMVSEAALNTKIRGGRIPYAAMTADSVAEFIEPHLIDLANEAPPELKPELFKGAWVFPSTEAKIVMRGCEDRKKANRLRGPAAIAAVVDEAAFIECLDYVVRSVVAPQLVTTRGWLLVCSSAPETPEHFFRDLATEAEADGTYMHAEIYSAPHLTEEDINDLARIMGGKTSPQWLRECLCRFIVDESSALVPEFLAVEKDVVVNEMPRPDHFDLYVIGDLGFTDLSVILLGYYDFDRALLVVVAEVVLRRATSDVINREVEAALAWYFPGRAPTERAVDAPAITAGDLRRQEVIANEERRRQDPSTPELAPESDPARWHTVANDELDAALNALRTRVGRKGLRIHSRCTTLIAHLRNGVWNERRTSFKRIKKSDGDVHHFDGVAALTYFNRKLRVGKNPNPPPALPEFGQAVVGGPKALEKMRESKWRQAFGRRGERR